MGKRKKEGEGRWTHHREKEFKPRWKQKEKGPT